MGLNTEISWADHTANYWEGCTQISPGCDNCYAMKRAQRYGSVEWNGPPRRVAAGAQVARAAQRIAERTGVKQVVFVNSLSDFFDKLAPAEWRRDALESMRAAPDCVFLILTKRVGNVERMIAEAGGWPANAWLGISVVNQAEADRDIPKALAAKAALRVPRLFLSVEPMLGAVDLNNLPSVSGVGRYLDALFDSAGSDLPGRVDWVICGGESQEGARPMHPDWARSLRDQCAAAGVPFMFKQWGEWTPGVNVSATSGTVAAAWHNGDKWIFGSENLANEDGHIDDEPDLYRVGKARAGRLLDGVEHNGRPAP